MKRNVTFRDDRGRVCEPFEVVFPVFASDGHRLEVLGTGFFVGKPGVFLTAAHVSRHFSADTHELFVPLISSVQEHPPMFRKVYDVLQHQVTDIALGLLEPTYLENGQLILNNTVALGSGLPAVGDMVHCYAFPQTIITAHDDTDVVIPLPRSAYGTVLEVYLKGRDSVMQPGPCIEVDFHIPNGASGGPVFNTHGQAIGIVSTGIQEASVTYVAPFFELLDVPFGFSQSESDGPLVPLTLRSVALIDQLPPQG